MDTVLGIALAIWLCVVAYKVADKAFDWYYGRGPR
jgi:hypothetical protein